MHHRARERERVREPEPRRSSLSSDSLPYIFNSLFIASIRYIKSAAAPLHTHMPTARKFALCYCLREAVARGDVARDVFTR
jgi:hypothetical protein